MSIHSTAIIDPSAELAEDVEVQAFSIIEAKVTIGAGSVIGPHCVIGAGAQLGKNNRTFSGAQLGVVPQDLKHKKGAIGKTHIGDNNVFREFVTISSSTDYGDGDDHKVTLIGSGCLFMACSHVGHDCTVGSGVIMANSAALAGHVTVHDRAILGGLTGVHQFCTVGKMAFLGAMSRVAQDALPYMILAGQPTLCHGPNVVGLERAGFSKETISHIRKMYKLLYRSNMNTSQAVKLIEDQVPECEERQVILDFVRNSKRGLQ
ncbi:MAG TPA: acyl-ACP--UDP-N-acetylglucosamine O-acyltransferase [Candidatus Hydrogenedentes bacterium]|nr:acyl-ACP--UDP-N-acetylglucosamine O-acyltransferase [Candidatus Hydrogenedentota bacterium]